MISRVQSVMNNNSNRRLQVNAQKHVPSKNDSFVILVSFRWQWNSPKIFNPLIGVFKINRILYLNCFSTSASIGRTQFLFRIFTPRNFVKLQISGDLLDFRFLTLIFAPMINNDKVYQKIGPDLTYASIIMDQIFYMNCSPFAGCFHKILVSRWGSSTYAWGLYAMIDIKQIDFIDCNLILPFYVKEFDLCWKMMRRAELLWKEYTIFKRLNKTYICRLKDQTSVAKRLAQIFICITILPSNQGEIGLFLLLSMDWPSWNSLIVLSFNGISWK